MPFKVYCRNCDIEDAVKTQSDLVDWHGDHNIDHKEVDEIEYSRIKRNRRAGSSGNNSAGADNSAGIGGVCSLCGCEYDGYLVAHLRNKCE